MTSDTLRKILIASAAVAAISVGACKKPADANDAGNTAAAESNSAMASSNDAAASSNTAAAAANQASNDAAATAPASANAAK